MKRWWNNLEEWERVAHRVGFRFFLASSVASATAAVLVFALARSTS